MARTYEELKAEMAEKRRAAESAKAAAPQVEPAPSAPTSPFAVPDYLKPPAALTAPEGLEVFEPAPRAKRIKKLAAPATPSVTRAMAGVQPKPQEILKTPEQAAEQVRTPEVQTAPRIELPPDMRREVDWKKVYDFSVGTSSDEAAKFSAEALKMTKEELQRLAQAQGVSLEGIYTARSKGRTYEEIARANRERGVLGFMPLAEREASFTQTVDDFEKAQRGEASEGIRLKKSGADQDVTGGYVAAGTQTELPEVSKPGEYGHLISETLVNALQKDPKASAFYDLYGRKLATGNTQKYIEERTKDLMDRAGVSASDPDSFDKRQKLRRRAINEILAYKTIGMWTPAVTMQDVQVTEGVEAPGFFASIGPNIELVGINNKGQAVYRQESPLGVLFRAIDIPQEAIVSKLEGRSAAEGIQTGANFLEYAIEHTEGESPYVRYPALAAGFLGSVAMPDLLVGPGMAAKGVKAAKRLYDVRKIAPRVLELLTDVAEARKSKDMAKAKKAEVALRNYTPQIADMLDRYDAAAARRFQMVDPIDEDIFNENVSALLATLDDEGAKALAAERVHLHPSMRKPETAAKLPTKDEPYAAFDELFNTDILEARVSKAKADYLATAPKTVEEHFARYAKGLTRTKLEAYKNAKVITPAELDDLARIVEASTAPALAGNMGQWKQSIQTTLNAHPVFSDPKFTEIRKAVYVNVGKSLESRAKSMVGLNIGDLNASDVAAFDRALTAISRNSEARGVAATLLHKEVADQAKVRVQPLELFDDVALSGPGGEPIRLTPGGVLFLSRIRNLLPEMPFKDVYAESVLIDNMVIARARKEGRDPFSVYEELFPEIRAATKDDIKRYKAMAAGGGPAPTLPGTPSPTQAGAPPTPPVTAPPAPPVPGPAITLGRARRPVRRPVPAPPDTLDLDVTEGMRLPDEELNLVVPEDIDITAAGGIPRTTERQTVLPPLFETEARDGAAAAPAPATTPTPAPPVGGDILRRPGRRYTYYSAREGRPPYVIETGPGIEGVRVFRRETDGSYTVIIDNIGDQALLPRKTTPAPTPAPAAEPTGEVTGEVTQSLFEPTREIPFRRTRAELVRRERELQQRAAGARERFAEFERTERIPEREVTEEMLEPTLKVAGSIEEAEVTEKVPNLVTTPVPKGYSVMPNKGNEYEVPWTAYLSGKDSAAVRAKAAERTDLGVLVTPHSSSILKNVDAYPFFAVDNGVFAAQGKGFSPEKFTKLLDQLAALPEPTKNKLLFVVAPDKLDWVDGAPRGDAAGTLEMFKFWGPKLRERGLPVAFVAQNGLEDMVDQIPWDDFDVLFIGGSDAWKVGDLQGEARQKWNALFDQVRAHGKPIHMGRVSGPERMLQSHARVGSATVDGTMLAVAPDQMMVKLERMLDDLNVQTKSTFDDYLYPETQQAPSAEDLATVARDARVKSFADAERYYPGFVINDTVPGLVNIAKAERRRVWNEITELRKTVTPEMPTEARVAEEVITEPKGILTQPGESPSTFGGAALEEIRSPRGGRVSLKFYTAQGSEYIITDTGETRRIKSVHANTGGEDAGLKDWNENVLFFRGKNWLPQAAGMLVENGKFISLRRSKIAENVESVTILVYDEGRNAWRPAAWEDAFPRAVKTGVLPKTTITGEASTVPEVGAHILEFDLRANGTVRELHAGSPVSYIEPRVSAAEEVVTEPAFQRAEAAAAAPVAEAAPAAAKAEAPTVAKPPTPEVAAANAGAPGMVTEDKVLSPAKARAEGNAPLEIPEKDLKETLGKFLFGQKDGWNNPFMPPKKTKTIPKKLPEIPQADANARIAEWKAEAARQGKSAHYGKGKVVLSLFDASGEWSKPWREAGYTVWSFDIQNGEDISKFSPEYLADTFGDFEGEVYAILAAPPCTNFTSTAARWWPRQDLAGETKASISLVDQTLAVIERYKPAVWVLENPAGRIKSLTGLPEPTLSFNPHNFGNPYTKRTLLWGDFNPELPTANVFPTEGSRIHKLSGKDKFGRSLTPEGFAYAFFMANNAEALGDAKVIAREMRGVPEDLVQKALDAGHEPSRIRTAVEDAFYMEQSPDEVRAILNDLIANPVAKAEEAVSAAPAQPSGITPAAVAPVVATETSKDLAKSLEAVKKLKTPKATEKFLREFGTSALAPAEKVQVYDSLATKLENLAEAEGGDDVLETLAATARNAERVNRQAAETLLREGGGLKQTGPAGVVKGATELRADGRSVIILFEGADPTTVLHEVAHILRRHVLDQDDMNAITGWLASRGVNVSHQYGEFVGTPDEIEKAEEFFAKAFEQYALEGAAPTPLLQSAFDTLKQAVAQVYLGVSDPVIGVKLQPEVRRVFDGLVATVDDQPNATLKQVLRRELLGAEDDSAEGFLNVLSREAQRKGMPRTALEDLQKQFETAKKNRVPADQTYVSFPAPVLGKRDWSFDDLAEFQAARTTEREIDAARKKGIFLDLSGKGMGTASVVEKGAVEELRAYFAYNKDIDDVNKVRGKAKAVVRVVLATFFGGDVVAERGGAQNLLRRAPPEFRQAIDAAERPIEQAIGDTITLVNDAIETNKRTELYRYLGGAGNVRRVAGRPILSAGHDYMGSVIGMIRRSIDDLKPEEKAALETLAEAINSPNRSAALVKLGFDPKSGNTLASVDASVVATREAASRAMSKILFSSKDANADFGASLASAIRGAVEAPANIARPTHEMLLVENLTYIAGLTERNGALFQGTSQDAVKVLLEGDGVRKGVAQIYDEDSARRMAIVIGGFGSSVVGKDTMVKLNLGIDADTYRAFVNWTNGQAWDFQYTEAIQRVVDRYGYNVEFVRDAVLDTDFYIPRLARDRMAESLARSSYRPSATVTGGDAFNILYRYMKKRMTRGSFFIRQRYYMMNTVDHFMQMAMTAGFGTAAASVSRVLVQDVMVLPFWQQIVDFVARRLPGGQRIPADILERFRAGLQVYGDRAANSVATIFSVGKYRIEVNPILEGLDGGFQAGGKVFSYRQIRDIAVQEGIFASFDTRQLASVIEREGALFAAPTLTGVSAAGTAGGGIIPAGLRNFMADWEKTVSETAEAWGERERLGAMITLMEAGHDPRTAARLTIDALYDYSQSMTKADRSMLVGIMFPFWAFQKNANAQVFNNIFSPWGAYRLMVLKRARERGAELLTELLYNDVGGEYGLDVKSMPPELQESYYAIVTAFEDSFNGQEPPEDAKRALKMLLTGRGRLIEEGKLAMLSPELKRLSDIGATADLQRFAEYTALPPSAAGRQSYLRDRTGVAMLFPRTKAVQMYYRLAGDDHSYMELFIPESSIEAGMRHHTQLAATYMLLSASALDLLPGIDLKEGGLDEVKALNVLKPITDPARSPVLAPLLSGTATGELAAPKRVSKRIAETAGLVTQVHPFIGKMMDDMYGTTFVRVPAIKDPFATDFEGNLIEVSEQAAAEMRELQKQFPDAAVLRDQRYYLPGGVWTTALENSPLGELNALLLRYEANPLERNDIRGEILSWARGAAGVDVELISPQKTIKREEPKKLKETPGTR